MGELIGADPESLDRLAANFNNTAKDFGSTQKNLSGPIHSSPWNGRKADQFRQRWDSEYARNIREAARFLDEHADILRRQAEEQRRASRDNGDLRIDPGGVCPVVPDADGEHGDDSNIPPELEAILDALEKLGLGHQVLDGLLEKMQDLIKSGALKVDDLRLLNKLLDDRLLSVIKAARHVMDVVSLIVDLVSDIAANDSKLSGFDIVEHAIYEAIFKFALSEGVEAALTWAGGALGAAFFGVGAVPGAALGKALGWGVSVVFDQIMDMTGTTESLADAFADRLVDFMNDPPGIDDVVGLVGDIGGAAVDFVSDLF